MTANGRWQDAATQRRVIYMKTMREEPRFDVVKYHTLQNIRERGIEGQKYVPEADVHACHSSC